MTTPMPTSCQALSSTQLTFDTFDTSLQGSEFERAKKAKCMILFIYCLKKPVCVERCHPPQNIALQHSVKSVKSPSTAQQPYD